MISSWNPCCNSARTLGAAREHGGSRRAGRWVLGHRGAGWVAAVPPPADMLTAGLTACGRVPASASTAQRCGSD
jgi:hypothetical protein